MAMDACRAILASTSRALITPLNARRPLQRLRNRRYSITSVSSGGSSAASSSPSSWPVVVIVVLAALLCAAAVAFSFPRAVAFFLPLAASTSAFCATAYLSASTTDPTAAAKEVVLVRGEGGPAEAGTLQVYADADASAYGGGGVRVGCFLRTSSTRGVDADGEEVVLAGRLILVSGPVAGGAFEEEVASLHVDRLAEGVWDSYFGRWSTWHHYGCDD